jgi:hypothetical protein
VPVQFKTQVQLMFEFMQLLVKPMVNSMMPDPRMTVTDLTISFIRQFKLP